MPQIPWSRLTNPVLTMPGWSLKDACMIEHDGLFHVFTSAFNQQRSTLIHLSTPDFIHWSPVLLQLTGQDLGAAGVCSPSVVRDPEGRFILHFNLWGPHPLDRPQLFAILSDDLQTWSPPQPLAGDLTAGRDAIDAALAFHGGNWFMTWKAGPVRVAQAPSLEGPWDFIGDEGLCRVTRPDDVDVAQEGLHHENAQFVQIDGLWHLLLTDYPPHEPWLYRMDGDPDEPRSWTRWVDGRVLRVPSEGFNSIAADLECVVQKQIDRALHPCWDDPSRVQIVDGLCNAAFLWDGRERDGWFYLLYGGKNEIGCNDFIGTTTRRPWPRGWNRLALARSRDLGTWEVPPAI